MYRLISLSIIFLILSGCGGGGSSSTPPPPVTIPPDKTFSLKKVYGRSLLDIYSYTVTGSSTDGATYTGSIDRAVLGERPEKGVLVVPVKYTFTLVSSGSAAQIFTSETLIDSANGYYISTKNSDGTNTVICTPATLEVLPLSVKVGDTGVFPIDSCDDGSTNEGTWKVEDAGDGTILYIVTGVSKDAGAPNTEYENTYNIDDTGIIISFKQVTKTLSSNNMLTIETVK